MRSDISFRGLPEFPEFYGSLNYLYGISDFWSFMFQDKAVVDRTLEATSYQLADIYSNFLQLASTISLFDIRNTFHSQIKLLLIDDSMVSTEADQDLSFDYNISEKILNSKYIMDRPFLPKIVLEEDVHYHLANDGTKLEFHKDLSKYGFPVRKIPKLDSDGNPVLDDLGNVIEYNQYALWVTDVEIDKGALWSYFGRFVKVDPGTSTDLYRDYIRGVCYLYSNGPTVSLLKRGLNLAIGIPFSRAREEVLDVVVDPQTGNYNLVTDTNSYTIPYGIVPDYSAGDILEEGVELAEVASIKDYITDGEWWINVSIPKKILPSYSVGEPSIATPGSKTEYYMKSFLKTHTFLVNIKLVASFSTESMTQVINLIDDAKPTYTLPVYVWQVPLTQDCFAANDDEFSMSGSMSLGDFMMFGEFIRRINLIARERSCGKWIRSNSSLLNPLYVGDVVDSTHLPVDSVNSSTEVPTLDSTLIPLYNATYLEVKTKLQTYGLTLPPALPERFLVGGVDGTDTGIYDLLFKREPTASTGIGYNQTELDLPFVLEAQRRFVPAIGDLTNNETLAIFQVVSGIYSVYLVRAVNTIFLPEIYFPPAEEDPITITQV